MDTSLSYRKQCLEDQNLQKKWIPQMGDWFFLKSSYCGEENERCSNEHPCDECLSMNNVFVISGVAPSGAAFFNGGFCTSGGILLDSTQCSVLVRKDEEAPWVSKFCKTYLSEVVWLPRPDQKRAS